MLRHEYEHVSGLSAKDEQRISFSQSRDECVAAQGLTLLVLQESRRRQLKLLFDLRLL